MKLRNKKTGENGQLNIIEFNVDYDDEIDVEILLTDTDGEAINKSFRSLDELKQYLDEWEDYAPKEPLIKDEKVRKAVRAWAEANRDVYRATYFIDYTFNRCCLRDTDSDAELTFNFTIIIGITGGKTYTITELCGEEE